MENEEKVANQLEAEQNMKRLHEYEPIDFLKALVENYKEKGEL